MCVSDDSPTLDHYQGRISIIVGAIVIVLQVLGVALNALGLKYLNATGFIPNFFTIMQPAAFSAIIIILFGAFAIAAGKTKSRCLIITQMVFAVISGVFAFVFLAIAIAALLFDAGEYHSGQGEQQKLAAVIIAAILVAIALTQFILSILGAVLGGKAVCCNPPRTETTFIALTTTPADNKY